MQNKQEMPKWFDGTVYSTGDTVSNPFTGDSVELTAEELSMYDLTAPGLRCLKVTTCFFIVSLTACRCHPSTLFSA